MDISNLSREQKIEKILQDHANKKAVTISSTLFPKEINSLKKELYEIISERTGQPYEKVHKDSDRDYWMTSKEAKKYGMIDEILIKRK